MAKEMSKFETVFRYGAVEVALASVLKVTSERMGVFKGKIRHLRNAGLPKERPGTGEFIRYDFKLVLEMLLVLTMEQIRITPKEAIGAARQMVERFIVSRGRERFAMLLPPQEAFSEEGVCVYQREKDKASLIKNLPLPAYTHIDVAIIADKLWLALEAAVRTE